MITKVKIEEIINAEDVVFIDVRSPKEYNEDTIPNAINIPIFTDAEREEIGYIYKQVSKDEASELGLKYASEKLLNVYRELKEIKNKDKSIALFCFRGGMRSNSIANVIDIMGIDIFLIQGGYKSYRNYVIRTLENYKDKFKYIVLHGYTGVGKTKILELLSQENQPIINLEDLAKNSGSVFGSIAFKSESRNQKSFESNLLYEFNQINDKYIFIESESRRIGNVILPEFVHNNIKNGIHIYVETNIGNRVINILDDYLNNETQEVDDKIIKAIMNLEKKLGINVINNLIDKIKNKQYNQVIEVLMIDYYDPLYDFSIKKIENYDKIVVYDKIEECIDTLIEFAKMI